MKRKPLANTDPIRLPERPINKDAIPGSINGYDPGRKKLNIKRTLLDLTSDSPFPGRLFPPGCFHFDKPSFDAPFDDFALSLYRHTFNRKTKICLTNEFYGLIFNPGNTIHYSTGGYEGKIEKDQLGMVSIPEGPCEYTFDGGLSIIAVQFRKSYLEDLIESFPLLEIPLTRFENYQPGQISTHIPADYMSEIFIQLHAQEPTVQFNEIIRECLARLSADYVPPGKALLYECQEIAKARHDLRKNPQQSFLMADLQHTTGLNKDKIQNLFKVLFHNSVAELRIKERLKKACRYLVLTDYPEHKIAEMSGYNSLHGLISACKGYTGYSPKGIRNSVSRQQEK